MTDGVYDEYAERWVKKARRGSSLSHDFLEKPAMFAKLPDLHGKRVLCLGCGSGEECQYLLEQGAAQVTGIDNSKGLIAQATYTYPDVTFEVMDMNALNFPDQSYDFVYSSLALHYIPEWTELLKRVYQILAPGGIFLFSTHHPIKWGAESKKDTAGVSVILGYERFDNGHHVLHGNYLDARKITDSVAAGLHITYYHQPLSGIFKSIIASGFILKDFTEPAPIPSARLEKEDFWAVHSSIPLFMIFELQKK